MLIHRTVTWLPKLLSNALTIYRVSAFVYRLTEPRKANTPVHLKSQKQQTTFGLEVGPSNSPKSKLKIEQRLKLTIMESKMNKRIFTGAAFLVIGLLLTFDNLDIFNFDLPSYVFRWYTFLIVLGIFLATVREKVGAGNYVDHYWINILDR